MVGRICPPGWKKVKVSENLIATAVVPVAPVDTSLGRGKLTYLAWEVKVAQWKTVFTKKPSQYSKFEFFPPKNSESYFCFGFNKEDNWVPYC